MPAGWLVLFFNRYFLAFSGIGRHRPCRFRNTGDPIKCYHPKNVGRMITLFLRKIAGETHLFPRCSVAVAYERTVGNDLHCRYPAFSTGRVLCKKERLPHALSVHKRRRTRADRQHSSCAGSAQPRSSRRSTLRSRESFFILVPLSRVES